jgi:hypothetical protein
MDDGVVVADAVVVVEYKMSTQMESLLTLDGKKVIIIIMYQTTLSNQVGKGNKEDLSSL